MSRALGFGSLIALIGHLTAVMLAGGGEGWNAPAWISFLLWFAYPLVLARAAHAASTGWSSTWPDLVTLAIAVAADVHLVLTSQGMEAIRTEHHFCEGFLELWVVIWIGWQFLALRNFVRAEGWQIQPSPARPLSDARQ